MHTDQCTSLMNIIVPKCTINSTSVSSHPAFIDCLGAKIPINFLTLGILVLITDTETEKSFLLCFFVLFCFTAVRRIRYKMWSGIPQWEYLRILSQYSFSWENLVVLNTWAASNEIRVFLPSTYCSEWGLWHNKSMLGLCDLTQKISEGGRWCAWSFIRCTWHVQHRVVVQREKAECHPTESLIFTLKQENLGFKGVCLISVRTLVSRS